MTIRPNAGMKRLGLAALAFGLFGCPGGAGGPGALVVVDGSSSLYALSEAVAEEFTDEFPQYRVAVRFSGSGGGLRRFCDGEIDIAAASRTMTSAEAARCRETGRDYVAIPVARDGIVIVTHPANTAVSCLSLAELRQLWRPGSEVTTWRDLRPALPAERIRLFGPGTASGTYDYFTTVVMGRPGASRADHYQTEDDHLIARGVAGNRWALGYFGSAGYAPSRDRLRVLAIDTGFGCVGPTPTALGDGSYSPLTRDLYIYVGRKSVLQDHVYNFALHYVSASERLASEIGYASLPAAEYARSRMLLAGARRGYP
ncbi:MAG: PstS family phosphate ABC transporter substrate-binding protein [Gemmatimonadetes bacterium]|nr:PstS family phosphate ABC transporter substrate-binding protein [Gemmatimonadota bacterium]